MNKFEKDYTNKKNKKKKENKENTRITEKKINKNNSKLETKKLKNNKSNKDKDNKNNRISKNKKINKNNKKYFFIGIKTILILCFIWVYFYLNSSFENTIPLLAVNENNDGKINGGSIIDLDLKIKPGSGNIYTNLNTIEEIDTQISIINSQKIACDLFKLNCENYDFYYNFKGSALLLKGPSASSAIAILTAKTINKEKINKNSVITGSLNSGGIIGNVGGVKEKIKIAKEKGFKRIIIPEFTDINNSEIKKLEDSKIEIIKAMDLIKAYNKFNNDNFKLKTYAINKTKFKTSMKILALNMCERANNLKKEINNLNLTNKSKEYIFLKRGNESLKSAREIEKTENYYSMGSFCYNANINFRIVLEDNKNLSDNELNEKIKRLENKINSKYLNLISNQYLNNIKTINDFYVYLILNNRLNEAKSYLDEIKLNEKRRKEKEEREERNNIKINISSKINTSNSSINREIINKTNKINKELNKNQSKYLNKSKDINRTKELEKIEKLQKISLYSSAEERFYTIKLWEIFLKHEGSEINLDENKISQICYNINREILIKEELLKKYNINYFQNNIQKQVNFNYSINNNYICIYNGIELKGRINTILNSIGIDNKNLLNYSKELNNFTLQRLSINSNGDFPLIPYIYSEYAYNLLKNNQSSSSMLYSNYALANLDLNLYLNSKTKKISLTNRILEDLFSNKIFIISILFLISFIGFN